MRWDNTGISWTTGDKISLRLSRPQPNPPGMTYGWTQTGGTAVSLSSATAQNPTFTAPSVREDLEFSLVVNDGTNPSAPDAVVVSVRPPLNPATAPCPPLTGVSVVTASLITFPSVGDTSFTFRTTRGGASDLHVCRPDGTSEQLANDVAQNHVQTVSGLTSGTRYWAAVVWWDGTKNHWSDWQAVTTTGGASILQVEFTSTPASGDTYGIGETIQAQVTWSQNVTVANGGDNANVSLRLDLGADDADQTNSRRKMGYASGSGTDTLTFEYTVKPGTTDIDADGVWLQTDSDAVVFLESGATITGGNPSSNSAVLTKSGLATTGDASRKVDGTSTATADAGEDQTVETGAPVTLEGSGSSTLGAVALVDAGQNLPGPHAPTGTVQGGVNQFTITWSRPTTGPTPNPDFYVLDATNVSTADSH